MEKLFYLLYSDTDLGPNYTTAEINAFITIGSIEIVLYTLLLLIASYNTYFFLIKQKRYRIYFITVFYMFAYLVSLSRLALASMLVLVASDYSRY